MICKITNFWEFFTTEKNSLNSLNFKSEKIRKIRILDLCLKRNSTVTPRNVQRYGRFTCSHRGTCRQAYVYTRHNNYADISS